MKAVFRFMLGLIPMASLFILLCCYNNQLNQLSSDDKLDKDLEFMIFLLFGGSFLMSFVTGAFVIKFSNTRRIFILLVYFFIFAFLIYYYEKYILGYIASILFLEFVCGFFFGGLFLMARRLKINERHWD